MGVRSPGGFGGTDAADEPTRTYSRRPPGDLTASAHPRRPKPTPSTYETFGAAEWIDGTRRFLTPLTETAGQILIIPGTPLLGFDGPACITEHLTADGRLPAEACHATGRLAQPATIAGYLTEAVAPIPNARVLDLNDLVCPADRCSALGRDGVPVYRDGRHLADSFVRARALQIAERVQRVMGNASAPWPPQP